MDITTLAAWGEFLCGIAVVVSLIYLASQVRQNSRLLRASTASVAQQSLNEMPSLITQDPELARIYRAGLTDRATLSEQDQSRFDPLLSVQVTGLQHQFRLARDGSLSPEVWADMKQADRWLVQQPGVR